MPYSHCPKCDRKIDVGEDPEIGLRLDCETCLADLVIVWLNPIELMTIDYEEDQFDGDLYNENFQKIRKKKGEYNASRKKQEKYQETRRKKEDR